MTNDLFECIAKPRGLRCDLVQEMTGTHSFSSADRDTAEQYVGVLRELPFDDQSRNATFKKNVERFVWEFLANRTFTGVPHDVPDKDGVLVGCDNNVNRCPDHEVWHKLSCNGSARAHEAASLAIEACLARCLQVCLHVSGKGGDQGQCVRADVKYTPAYPTNVKFAPCLPSKRAECGSVWELAETEESSRDPAAWASSHNLPEDPMWTETFNEDVTVTVNLRERPLHDAVLFVCGIVSTALVTAVVIGIKALHKRQKHD